MSLFIGKNNSHWSSVLLRYSRVNLKRVILWAADNFGRFALFKRGHCHFLNSPSYSLWSHVDSMHLNQLFLDVTGVRKRFRCEVVTINNNWYLLKFCLYRGFFFESVSINVQYTLKTVDCFKFKFLAIVCWSKPSHTNAITRVVYSDQISPFMVTKPLLSLKGLCNTIWNNSLYWKKENNNNFKLKIHALKSYA